MFRIVGSAIGPLVAAMFLESYQYSVVIGGKIRGAATGPIVQYYPSAESYDLIYLTCALLTLFSLALALMLARRTAKCQNHLREERGEMRAAIVKTIKSEIMSWSGVKSQ